MSESIHTMPCHPHCDVFSTCLDLAPECDDVIFTIDVFFTTHRPVRPDERKHRLRFAFPDHPLDAEVFACLWVGARPGVEMVTRSRIVALEL